MLKWLRLLHQSNHNYKAIKSSKTLSALKLGENESEFFKKSVRVVHFSITPKVKSEKAHALTSS